MVDLERRSLPAALTAWQAAIGAENVEIDTAALAAATQTTFAVERRLRALLRPGTTAEVQECVRIAAAHGLPLYALSSGLNWGYGSGSPVVDGHVLVDLRRLNKIRAFDEELATVTVEAGVTQEQLQKFLDEKGGKLWMDSTASSVQSSLIGNAAERGHGVTPYADHAATTSDLEVVLADGSQIVTGFGGFKSPSPMPDHYGVGPAIEGLFLQSNLGIVTAGTIWLMPKPQHTAVVFFQCRTDEDARQAIDRLRALRLDGSVRFGPFLANVYRSLSRVMRYPWDRMGGQVPMPEETALKLAKEHHIDAWVGAFGIYGTRAQVAAHKKQVKRALRGLTTDCVFLTERLLRFTRWLPHRRLDMARKLFPSFQGRPTGRGLMTTYWRAPPDWKEPADLHLDKNRCGFMLIAVATPFKGRDVMQLNRICIDTCLEFELEASIGVAAVRERTIHNSIAISFDRAKPGEDQRALDCQQAIIERLAAAGYYPHRLSTASMSAMSMLSPEYKAVLRTLKSALDPAGILSHGRYEAPPG